MTPAYTVSARKYRPGTFESVVGQSHVTNTLRNAVKSNHLAQAYLFTGPRGVGKTTCARILAKAINCINPPGDGEPCNQCESCVSFNNGQSFTVYELDAASNNSVDDIRALVEQVRFAPQNAKYKVYIIDEVHMLSQAAFNAFLKTLEEPPSYAVFILATTEKHKLLPTILSRCQIFDFHRISTNGALGQLQYVAREEGIDAEESALYAIAQKADGGMRDALSLFDRLTGSSLDGKLTYAQVAELLNILDYDYYFTTVSLLLDADVAQVLLLLDTIIDLGYDPQLFLSGLTGHLRNLLVSSNPKTVSILDAAQDLRARYIGQASEAGSAWIINALQVSSTSEVQYRISRHPRLHVELTLMKLAHLKDAIHLFQENPQEDIKKKRLT